MLVLILIAVLVLCFILSALFVYLRPKFPIHVNCWFCGETTKVPYGNKNCWDCPSCEQYNGFNKDGDYNKPIPAQYSEDFNFPVGCQDQGSEWIIKDNVLCEKCNQNQLLKVKQLAAFVPLNEADYDREVEMFQAHLEKIYGLCEDCQEGVDTELGKQAYWLNKKLQLIGADSNISSTPNKADSTQVIKTVRTWSLTGVAVKLLDVCALTCGSLLGLEILHQHFPGFFPYHLETVSSNFDVLAVTGILMSTLAKFLLGIYRLVGLDVLNILVWGMVTVLATHRAQEIVAQLGTEWIITPACHIVNILLCVVSVLLNRKNRSHVRHHIKRYSLDSSRQSDLSQDSESSHIPSASESCYNVRTDDHQMDATLSELGTFSIGTASQGLKRSDSGIFTQTSFAFGNPVSTAGFNFSQTYGQRRPLISPAKFSVGSFSSSENIFLSAKKEDNNNSGGSLLQRNQRFDGFIQKSSSNQSSVSGFGKSSVFGETPYKLNTGNGNSTLGETTLTSHEVDNFSPIGRSWALRNHPIRSITEEKESVISRSSLACPVDSTTTMENKVPFWKTSGFLGFIMGASFVANVGLAYGFLQKT